MGVRVGVRVHVRVHVRVCICVCAGLERLFHSIFDETTTERETVKNKISVNSLPNSPSF